jgi:beta-lactamase regulating signal transducer with metallopeptidase domain
MTNLLNTIAEHWFDWQLAMLWQTGILICIIWIVDVLIRKWAHPQVRYALWMLVLVKLLIPPTFTSPASVTSHIPAVAIRAATVISGQGSSGILPESKMPSEQSGQSVPASDEIVTPASNRAATVMERVNSSPSAKGEYPERGRGYLSWKAYAMFIWLAGVLILSAWLFIRLSVLRREHIAGWHGQAVLGRGVTEQGIRTSTLPERFYTQLEEVASKLGLKRLPRVVLTDKVACPAVFGVFRPVLLMPKRSTGILPVSDNPVLPMTNQEDKSDTGVPPVKHGRDGHATMTARETEHILLHELAHIKRGDLVVHAVYMLLQIVYWFNPLLWLIRKTLQNLRELCCDATVAKLLRENTVHYRQTLLETARQLLAEPVDPGLGLLGLFENNNWLVTRLQWLEKNTWKNRPWRIATIIALVAVMTTCVLPMANRQKLTTEDTEAAENKYIKHLDNGVTVELVGVCSFPSKGKQWWQPDGSPCDMTIETEDHSNYKYNYPGYEFIFKTVGIENKGALRLDVKGYNQQSGLTVKSPEGLVGWRSHIKPRYKETTIKMGILGDDWKTVATHTGYGTTDAKVNGKRIIFSPASNSGNEFSITVSDELSYDLGKRAVAVDKDGQMHVGKNIGGLGIDDMKQNTWQFKGVERNSIKEFQFQTQEYQWVTFEDVALRPGGEVQSSVTSEQLSEKEAEEKSTNSELRTENSTSVSSPQSSGQKQEWVVKHDSGRGSGAERPQIAIEAKVFTVKVTHAEVAEQLKSSGVAVELNPMGMLSLTNLTDAQSSAIEKWMASLAGTSALVCPKVRVFDGEKTQLALNDTHTFTAGYDGDTPKVDEFTTGVTFEFTPAYQKQDDVIRLTLAFDKKMIIDIMKQTDDAGRETELPGIGTQSVHTTVEIPQGKTMLVPVAGTGGMGGMTGTASPAPKTEQIFLLIKMELEKQP